MSTDKTAALEQWKLAHRQARGLINSLENSPYINRLVWAGAAKLLSALDSLMRGMLEA